MPWAQRLLPFVVMMSIILGGTMLPAASLVEEKQKRTLTAVVSTTTTLEEIFASKAILGFIVSFVMGLVILILNQAFGQQPTLLFLVLGMGALLSALFGVILGALVKDINSLFATIKGIGILLLYAPALIYLFPTLPQWTAQLFPTYYMIHPIIAITQEGATWARHQLGSRRPRRD
jgi:ABC-2 type transport system permease protein